jgi:hypothetical protein
VSVFDTADNPVVTTLPVGNSPVALGLFIQPAKALFAGTVGQKNRIGKSVSAATRHHGGMSRAASALGYAGVAELQAAIAAYCGR